MSLALLEAMVSSRSLVVSDVAGMREALVEGPLPPGGAVVSGQGELADAIVARLRDADLATREGRAARQRVEASFDRDETVRTIGDLTESLAATGAMVTR
jgi:glycosyltransferase involved in cell wall biosynthesis